MIGSSRIELATDSASLPRLFVGKDALVHTRRPAAWRTLSEVDAALLDFLRSRGALSELPAEETAQKLLEHFREPGRFERLLKVAPSEPPRTSSMTNGVALNAAVRNAMTWLISCDHLLLTRQPP